MNAARSTQGSPTLGMDTEKDPGKKSLIYHPSKVSWAVAEVVAKPPASLARSIFYLISFALLSFLVFAHFSKISITVNGRGMVRSTLNTTPIRAPVTGELKSILVKQGQSVKKGQPLAEMADVLSPAEIQSFNRRLLELENLSRSNPEMFGTFQLGKTLAETPIDISRKTLVGEYSALNKTVQDYAQSLQYLHQEVGQLNQGDQTQLGIANSKLNVIQRKGLQKSLVQDFEELKSQVAQLQASINSRRSQARSSALQGQSNLKQQLKVFTELYRGFVKDQRILAPVEGVVLGISVAGQGEFVQAGSELFQIIPEGGGFIAEIAMANKDIANLQPGLPIKYKLDAYPYQEYGFILGQVTHVPQDVTTPGGKDQESVYLVKGSFNQTFVQAGNDRKELRLGMTLTADIQTRKRTLLKLIVFEVLKFKEQFFN